MLSIPPPPIASLARHRAKTLWTRRFFALGLSAPALKKYFGKDSIYLHASGSSARSKARGNSSEPRTTGCFPRRSRPFLQAWEPIGRRSRIDVAIKAHEEWYKGDGAYGDGPDYHWDYYQTATSSSRCCSPCSTSSRPSMRAGAACATLCSSAPAVTRPCRSDSSRPMSSSPPLGRSITRLSVRHVHHLATMALRRELPAGIAPAQVRGALSAVIRPPHARRAGHVRRRGLAAYRPRGPPAIARRDLHQHRQPLPLHLRIPPARSRSGGQTWSAPGCRLDRAQALVRR